MAHILVIDDDEQVRFFLRKALELGGHRVAEAADGAKGIQAYKKEPPDLVFCDIIMPDKEGLQTIRELRVLYPEVKIIAMSGGSPRSNMDFLPVAKMLGAVRVLHKPLDVATVLESVRECLAAAN